MFELNRAYFDLDRLDATEEAPSLVLGYDQALHPCEAGSSVCVGKIEFWMRPLTGRDERAITDSMITASRKGGARYNAGKMAQTRVCRSVVRVRGLGSGSVEHETITPEVYDRLPKWMVEKLQAKVQEINGEEAVDEGE